MSFVRVNRLLPAVVAALALLFALLDPPASRALPFGAAFAFWCLHIGIGMLLAVGATSALGRARSVAAWHPWARLIAGGVSGSMLFAPIALGLDALWPAAAVDEIPDDLLDDWESAGGPLALVAEWLSLLPSYLASWLLVNVVPLARQSSDIHPALARDHRVVAAAAAPRPAGSPERRSPLADGHQSETADPVGARAPAEDQAAKPVAEADAGPGGDPSPATFLSLLPPAVGSDIVSIQADLHYLHVRTTRGRATILASMSAAETALGELGLRVHRSHWIALAHVARVARTARGTILILSDGARVPVSRRRSAEVQARLGRDFVIDAS